MTDLPRTARILLVDDNASDVELTLDAFSEAHVTSHIDVARSGREALDRLFGRIMRPDGGRDPLPDLVLLDLKMPGIDGFEVLRQVKAAPVLRRIPVVILTSSREEGDRAMSFDSGANSYVVKPVLQAPTRRDSTRQWQVVPLGTGSFGAYLTAGAPRRGSRRPQR